MRWRGRERSENVRDHRGKVPKAALGGGGGLLVIIVVLLTRWLGGGQQAQNLAGGLAREFQQRQVQIEPAADDGIQDDNREFISVVLNDTEDVWSNVFQEEGLGVYQPPVLNIFTDRINTACGMGQAAMGPFYCPADREVYIDPTFFDDLAQRHSAPGDFAQAYVIAHEVAHHIQNLLGWNQAVQQARRSGDKPAANRMSVRLELQADYLAGVWAHHAHKEYGILEPGDLEEAIQAANQIGDDTLQRQATGTVVPERFTHGSSRQRVRWFTQGLKTGNFDDARLLFEIEFRRL